MAMSFGGVSKSKVATIIVAADGSGDTTDIQTGINMLPAGGGGVYVKEGTYTITSTITITSNNVSLIGSGWATKITTSDDIDMIWVNSADNVLIRDLLIEGSGSGNSSNNGIYTDNNYQAFIEGCRIYSCGNHGMYFRGLSDSFILKNQCYCNYGHGMYFESSDKNNISNNSVLFNDYAETASYDGIHLGITEVAGIGCKYNIVSNDVVRLNDRYQVNVADAACESNIILGNLLDIYECVGGLNDSGTGTEIGHNLTVT